MKQLKKISTLLLVLAAMAMVATSCKKSDEKNLEGTWRAYSFQDDEDIYYPQDDILMVLKSGGKGEYVEDGESESIRWKADDDYLYISYYDDEEGGYSDYDGVEYELTDDNKTLILYSGDIEVWQKQ